MKHIFMDESGCISFSGNGTAYFLLASLMTDDGKRVSKTIKNFNGHLIRNGWPKDLEIKASNLWHAGKNPGVPNTYKYKRSSGEAIEYILGQLAALDIHIEYVIVKLDTVKPALHKLPYGILYNFYSWQLLKGPLCTLPTVDLYVDRRNRESHDFLKFDGYIETSAAKERTLSGRDPIALHIYHYHSDLPAHCAAQEKPRVDFGVRGLEAADLICWAIKWNYENQVDKWRTIIAGKIKNSQHIEFDPKNLAAKKQGS